MNRKNPLAIPYFDNLPPRAIPALQSAFDKAMEGYFGTAAIYRFFCNDMSGLGISPPMQPVMTQWIENVRKGDVFRPGGEVKRRASNKATVEADAASLAHEDAPESEEPLASVPTAPIAAEQIKVIGIDLGETVDLPDDDALRAAVDENLRAFANLGAIEPWKQQLDARMRPKEPQAGQATSTSQEERRLVTRNGIRVDGSSFAHIGIPVGTEVVIERIPGDQDHINVFDAQTRVALGKAFREADAKPFFTPEFAAEDGDKLLARLANTARRVAREQAVLAIDEISEELERAARKTAQDLVVGVLRDLLVELERDPA